MTTSVLIVLAVRALDRDVRVGYANDDAVWLGLSLIQGLAFQAWRGSAAERWSATRAGASAARTASTTRRRSYGFPDDLERLGVADEPLERRLVGRGQHELAPL